MEIEEENNEEDYEDLDLKENPIKNEESEDKQDISYLT